MFIRKWHTTMYGRLLWIQNNSFQPRNGTYTYLHERLNIQTKSDQWLWRSNIILSRRNRDKLFDSEVGLADATISKAELTAVHAALRWYVFENQYHYPVHIFTDGKYTYEAVCSPNPRKKNFYLVEEIQNYARQITAHNTDHQPVIHYVPSHIEQTSAGLKFTGNYFADKLADRGRKKSKPSDSRNFVHAVRERILTSTVDLIHSIEEKLHELEQPDGPSTPGRL